MTATFLEEDLTELRQKNLLRKIKSLKSISPVKAEWEGKKLLLFCGNDYLGLSHDKRVIAAAKETAESSGVGAGAARLISGTSLFHTELENKLAKFRKKEKALVFSAGYLANLGVLSALAGEKDLIVMDKLCHASLIDGARLSGAELRVFPHKNYRRAEEILSNQLRGRRKLLVSDSVFSMDGDSADLDVLVQIKKDHDALLIIDDAHGMGVLGKSGAGGIEDAGLEAQIDVITGTLSKSLGCLGGFAAGSGQMIDYLTNHTRPFIFATALPPMICKAAFRAIEIIEQEPALLKKLRDNIQWLRDAFHHLGFELPDGNSAIFPVKIGEEEKAVKASEFLLQSGIFVPAVRFPTVAKGSARLRVTVSASHNVQDLEQLIAALRQVQKSITH